MKKPLIVILAGGIGKSFAPISTDKTLLPFCGKPILQHTIEMAESADFNEALIITNEENEKWLSSYQPFNITLQTHIVRPDGMGSALLEAADHLYNRSIIIINAVDAVEPSFMKEFKMNIQNSYAAITGLKTNKYFPAGYIKKEGKRVLEIIEKPGEGNEPSNLINLVFHYFSDSTDLIQVLKTLETSDDQYEKALNILMQQKQIDLLEYKGLWKKLKNPNNVLDVMDVFLKTRVKKFVSRSAYVSPHAVLEGEVYIDEGSHIDAFAVLKGPVYIGKNVKIGNHSLVRQSVIEENSVVGFSSEVARSYIGKNCMLHNNFVGDSILESNVNPSWGTTFANYRLDKKEIKIKVGDKMIPTGREKFGAVVAKDVFLGVNCSVMPGVTIPEGEKIYPGSIIK